MPDFSAGCDRIHHPLRTQENKCLRCRNLVPLAKGILKKRPGSVAYLTITDPDGYTIKRIVELKDFPNLSYMLAVARCEVPGGTFVDRLYVSKSGAAFTYLKEFTASDIYSIVEFLTYVYISNGTEVIQKYDGITLSSLTGTNIPLGRILLVWKDRLWVADDDSAYYSDNLDPTVFQIASVITPRKSQGDNDTVIGLGIATVTTSTEGLSSMLAIFKSNTTWVLGFDTEPTYLDQLSGEIGCSSPKSIANTPAGLIWTDKDNVYLLNNGEPVPLGDDILSILNGTDLELVRNTDDYYLLRNVGVYFRGFYRLSFATTGVTSETSFYNDNEWWLDLRKGMTEYGWYGEQSLQLSSYAVSGSTLYGGSSKSGKIFLLDQSVYTDDGVDIDIALWTKYYPMDSEYYTKIFKRVGFNLSSDKATTLSIDTIIDQGKVWHEGSTITIPASIARYDTTGDTWDSARWYLGENYWDVYRLFFSSSDRGRFIGFRVSENSDANILFNNALISYLRTNRVL